MKQQYSDLPAGAEVIGDGQYSDLPAGAQVVPSAPANAPPIGSIGPQETGVGHYLQGVKSDIETGGGTTMPGRLLRWLGATGINSGTSPEAAAQIAGPLVGPVNAAIGVSQMGQHPIMGALHAASGALQAASPALAFVAPEAAGDIPNAISGANKISAAKQLFSQVAGKANKIAVDASGPNEVVQEALKLQEAGTNLPQVMKKWIARVTDPDRGPITYEEARRFYSNASRISTNEFGRLTEPMQRQVAMFAKSLNESITGSAGQVGQADNYIQALSKYAAGKNQQKTVQEITDLLKKNAASAVAQTGAGALGAYGAYRLLNKR